MTMRRLAPFVHEDSRKHHTRGRALATAVLLIAACAIPIRASADEVLDWNAVAVRAIRIGAVPGPVQSRALATVHTAMFDALNGIERRFTSIHVPAGAPRGASQRAAVVQAAYTALVGLFPAQIADFDGDLEASLAAIAADAAIENSESIARGRLWGEEVAMAVLLWRSLDGLNPPGQAYVGNTGVGQWRPTPPGFLPMLVPNMAVMAPFVIESPTDFQPAGPPPLASEEYAAAVAEVEAVGALVSATRSEDQTESARFWAGTAASFWNRAGVMASQQRHLTLSENARLFALLNIAQADALIAAWDSKVLFNFWRPITAIRLASTDGNPQTIEDPTWAPLITEPPYPEYTSGHQSVSGTSQAVLTAYFGAEPVEGFSEALPGVVRRWPNFAAAADEALLARIWSGIHFRFTMVETRVIAEQVAAYVVENAAQPLNGKRTGQAPD